jgi:predicted HAD superfamily phosphohydrolase YqeG
MREMGAKKEETALIGDQIFTDLLAAKNAKIRMILVKPINTKIENNFFKVKRFLEKLVYKRRI